MWRRRHLIAVGGSIVMTMTIVVAALAIGKYGVILFGLGLDHYRWWWGPMLSTSWIFFVVLAMFIFHRRTGRQ
jgi:hypothetical protein